MHRVLQESMCKHGVRRKVAKRTLNVLGTASGLCAVLNDDEELKKLKDNLKFAVSLEQVKSGERQRKEIVAKQKTHAKQKADAARIERAKKKEVKMKKLVQQARNKLGISNTARFTVSHLSKIPSSMLCAIAFVHFNKVVLTGKVEDKRSKLRLLLGKDDTSCSTTASSSNPKSPDELNPNSKFDELHVSDIVEVYWKGEQKWYEGEVTDLDLDDMTVEIHYKSDGKKLYHSLDTYQMRLVD